MNKIAIIGGRLQGIEAVYLAQKAGFETILIDKSENVPAIGLADHFICSDIINKEPILINELNKADFILPALENEEALNVLTELAAQYDFKLAFDLGAYLISSSKRLSDALMFENNIPAPKYYPNCKAPYIIKPSFGSGSDGVKYIDSEAEMEEFLKNTPDIENYVIQEFLSGRSYSIEVVGNLGNYNTYEVTELFMDEIYDCKRVTASMNISDEMKSRFSEIAINLANILSLEGIMDVEVIDDNGELKVLEVDARLPSQTPTVVYHSSGVNIIEEIRDNFCSKRFKKIYCKAKKYVSYEHLLIDNECIKVQGEHIMSDVKNLRLLTNFCGADEVLTDYEPGNSIFRGTFINISETEEELNNKRNKMIEEINILKGRKLEFLDLGPLY